MIVLAILATIAAVVWSWIVLMANGMSDAPSAGFQGAWSLWLAWGIVIALWAGWWID